MTDSITMPESVRTSSSVMIATSSNAAESSRAPTNTAFLPHRRLRNRCHPRSLLSGNRFTTRGTHGRQFGRRIANCGARKFPVTCGRGHELQYRNARRRGLYWRPSQQGRVSRDSDGLRKKVSTDGDDPFGDIATDEIPKKQLEEILNHGDAEAAGLLHGALEGYAKELATVARRFLKLKAWRDTERLVIGGGFRAGRIGELAIGRTAVLLKANDVDLEVVPIRNDPDEAGLIGAIHLAPSWIFKSHDAILAIDIGGTNIRAGVVQLNLKKAKDLSKAAVWKSDLWRHADEKTTREGAIARIVDILENLIARTQKEGLKIWRRL